jgi:hypothetical protein
MKHIPGSLFLFFVATFLTASLILAAPDGQGDILPTPTPVPVEKVTYSLTTVGGEDQTLTIAHEDAEGFTLGATTITSHYPRGMVFTLQPESANGAIQDVILFIRYSHGSGTRVVAEPDADVPGGWLAHPWATGEGQPAWTHFEFYWRVRDVTGATVDTAPVPMDYWDPSRRWFRMETPYYIVYWYGMSADDPDRFARQAAFAIESTEPRRIAGFGQPISYVPIAVIYNSRADWGEIYASGISDSTAGGVTSNTLGMSVQFAPNSPVENQINVLSHIITHELTHMYQFDIVGGSPGPNWWIEGQAEWFGFAPDAYDQRLMKLAQLQDLPTLSREVTRNLSQADDLAYLVYHMGASFVNWFVTEYGIETHAAVVELMKHNTGFYDAMEQVTGEPFLNLENRWRAYIGLPPLELADLDPTAALEPPRDPVFETGAVVTLPATPALVPLNEVPGPRSLASGQCFASMTVTVLRVGSLDGVDYYEVDCMGQVGWVTQETLVGSP